MSTTGEAVRVLSASDEGGWAVQTEGVRGVVEREEARALPAVVVSVAGATRGGKSFLLGFFLRYLHATPEQRADGSWLGTPHDPLRGFAWRGGSDRDTTGILMWSEPIIMTLESGEKVGVILMDTQGTFDCSSTIRDSTTIFALSTLLSSVQIYNLSQNIKEDDLQYLEYFAQYGRLAGAGGAGDEGDTPFQTLQFLVRDWSYAYQHPVGEQGGQQLLEKRLQSNCREELQLTRKNIFACFDSVKCFLMPHPGLKVTNDPDFNGHLDDISVEFKQALLLLAPAILAPNNLVIKKINGQTVLVQDLFQYINAYVDVFNSEELPTPVTILQASSSASLEAAVEAARDAYTRSMSAALSHGVSGGAVLRAHCAARQVACDTLDARRTLAAPHTLTARRDHLMKELEALLPHYIALNEEKLRKVVTEAEGVYRAPFDGVPAERCLVPSQVDLMHAEAAAAAIDYFDTTKFPSDSDEDDDDERRTMLLQRIEELLVIFKVKNDEKIQKVLQNAQEVYNSAFPESKKLCYQSRNLAEMIDQARTRALTEFDSHWDPAHIDNEHKTTLLTFLTNKRLAQIRTNFNNNNKAIKKAVIHYREIMGQFCDDPGRCVHPWHLRAESQSATLSATVNFEDCRMDTSEIEHYHSDEYRVKLIEEIQKCYTEYHEINEKNNDRAVQRAHNSYKIRMNIIEGVNGTLGLMINPDFSVFAKHGNAKRQVLTMFQEELRHPYYEDPVVDKHLDELKKQIQGSYDWLVTKIIGGVGFQLLNLGLLASSVLRK